MKNLAAILLAIVLIAELGFGSWLLIKQKNVAALEDDVESRELKVESRELKSEQKETRLQTREVNADEQKRELDIRERKLVEFKEQQDARLISLNEQEDKHEKRVENLASERAEYEKKKDEEEEEDELQIALAQDLSASLRRIRGAIENTERGGGGRFGDSATGIGPKGGPADGQPNSVAPEIQVQKTVEHYAERIRSVSDAAPTDPTLIKAQAKAIAYMQMASAESLTRGSVEWFRCQAEVDVRLSVFENVVEALGIPEAILPANTYRLLAAEALENLISQRSRNIAFLQEQKALYEPLGFDAAIESEQALLTKLKDAQRSPVSLTDLDARIQFWILKTDPPASKIKSVNGLLPSDSEFESLISNREANLIAKDLAIIDPRSYEYIALSERLTLLAEERRLSRSIIQEFQRLSTRKAVIDNLEFSSPREIEKTRERILRKETVGDAIKLLNETRYSEPKLAAELHAQLVKTCEADLQTPVAADPEAFEKWCAGHLSSHEISEAIILRSQAILNVMDAAKAKFDAFVINSDDRAELEQRRDSYAAELRERLDSSPEPRLQTKLYEKLEPQLVYNRLRQLEARYTLPIYKSLWSPYAVQGLNSQLNQIENATELLNRKVVENKLLNKRMTSFGETSNAPNAVEQAQKKIREAVESISKSAIELDSSAALDELKARVASLEAALPPPLERATAESIASAQHWADPFVLKALQSVGEMMKEIGAMNTQLQYRITSIGRAKALEKIAQQKSESASKAAKAVLQEYPSFFEGNNMPHFQKLDKQRQIEILADLLSGMGDKSELGMLAQTLSEASGNQGSTYGGRYRNVMERTYSEAEIRYVGKDKWGHELYRVDGYLKNYKPETGMCCPVYIFK